MNRPVIERILLSFERHKYVYLIAYFILGLLVLCFTELKSPISSYLDHHLSTISSLANIATLVGAVLALAGLKLIWRELRHNKDQAKKQRTYELVSKFYDPSFAIHMYNAGKFLRNGLITDEEKWTMFSDDNHEQNEKIRPACYILFTFFEDISQMYNKNLIDHDIVIKSCARPLVLYFNQAKWLINLMKNEYGNTVYEEWETCKKELEKIIVVANQKE